MSAAPDSARPAREHSASTRGLHLRRILRGRAAGYALALGAVGAFVAGAWLRSVPAMLLGPAVAAAVVMLVAHRVAGARAEQEFFQSFARARGLRYVGGITLPPLTPLLAAGDRRECRHWMVGPLGGRGSGFECGLGHYTWFERKGDQPSPWTNWPASPAPRSRGLADRSAKHEFTIATVDLEPGITLFPGVFLARRRGLAGLLGDGWLHTGTRRRVELESARLHERYELWVERSQDDLLLRQLFSPAFVAWLAEHPLEPCFEYRAGALVVYLERRLADAGRLGWLLDATARITGRLAAEIAQAAGRGRAA